MLSTVTEAIAMRCGPCLGDRISLLREKNDRWPLGPVGLQERRSAHTTARRRLSLSPLAHISACPGLGPLGSARGEWQQGRMRGEVEGTGANFLIVLNQLLSRAIRSNTLPPRQRRLCHSCPDLPPCA
eukprot:scaffold19682_cov28-Tisochrysis_lutea.AAC.4